LQRGNAGFRGAVEKTARARFSIRARSTTERSGKNKECGNCATETTRIRKHCFSPFSVHAAGAVFLRKPLVLHSGSAGLQLVAAARLMPVGRPARLRVVAIIVRENSAHDYIAFMPTTTLMLLIFPAKPREDASAGR
jgi:hypothetical protein